MTVGAGGTFALVDGVADFSANANTDSSISGSLSVEGGDFTVARRLLVANNGSITIERGSLTTVNTTTAASIGGTSGGSTGGYFLNGGDIDFRFMQFGNASVDFFFGGTTAGNITVENFGGFRHNPSFIDLDFASGSLMTLTLTDPVAFDDPTGDDRFGWANADGGPAWAEALWSDGRLTFDGQDFNALGDWNTVNGTIFDFDGNTLALAAIPEPSSSALLCVGVTGLVVIRRRHRI